MCQSVADNPLHEPYRKENSRTMKKGLLVVSFGTTFPDAREKSIHSIENTLSRAFPEYPLYRAFTSEIVRKRIWEQEGISIDNVSEALHRMKKEGIQEVVIQSTHVIPGEEYDKVLAAARYFGGQFQTIHIGKPLLAAPEDYLQTIEVLNNKYHFDRLAKNEAVILMGHGTEHMANQCYHQFQAFLNKQGLTNVLMSTVEGTPEFPDTLSVLKRSAYKKVTLIPFMVVAGDHVRNDLLGEDKTSWKTQLQTAGYEVNGHMNGLGELSGIRQLFLAHLSDTLHGDCSI